MSILLGVNIDHSATLRQARYRAAGRSCGGLVEPDPVAIALAAEQAGADGITVHLREDRRHIVDRDVERLRECLRTRLNLEMACTEPMLGLARGLRPDAVCLVPENRQEVTTEGGLDVAARPELMRRFAGELGAAGIEVSLFIDPDPGQVAAAAAAGAPVVELHTGAWAQAWGTARQAVEWGRLVAAAEAARAAGLVVNAGHGITYVNVRDVRRLPHAHEFNIGHSILCRALLEGIGPAVAEMRRRMRGE